MFYKAAFRSEPGVNCKVLFPLPEGAVQEALLTGMTVTDGGTATVEDTAEGRSLAVEGRGTVEAIFEAVVGAGVGQGGIPEVTLTRGIPDGGAGAFYLRVNKGGSSLVPLAFEFSATRDCGNGCGGQKSWLFEGPVGLSRQEVTMTYSEEKQK